MIKYVLVFAISMTCTPCIFFRGQYQPPEQVWIYCSVHGMQHGTFGYSQGIDKTK